LALGFFAVGLGILGCGARGPKTYPFSGKIDLAGGDLSALAGSHIDVAHQSNPKLRASGAIQQDGSFTLQTHQEGVIRQGVQEGTYRVRIILNDDDPASQKRAGRVIARRFLSFETSGLSIQVPAATEVTLKAAAK